MKIKRGEELMRTKSNAAVEIQINGILDGCCCMSLCCEFDYTHRC